MTVATAAPSANPAATRDKVTSVSRCNSPVRARSTNVWKTTEGGGARRPVDQPSRTTISQATARVTGTIKPRAGQMNRARRFAADRSCAGVPSAAMVMLTRDMVQWPNAMCSFPGAAQHAVMRCRPGIVRDLAFGAIPDLRCTAIALHRIRETVNSRRAHETIVNQIVERFFDVDVTGDDSGLLQRQSGLEDGVALRRADAVEIKIGALLKLDIDHRAGKLGRLDEHALLVVVVRQAIFARVLIDREHAPRQVGIGFEKFLAAVEDAVGIGVFVAIK